MRQNGHSIRFKCVHALLWMHLLVYVGLNLFQFNNFLSARLELVNDVKSQTTTFDESFAGEEETENKHLSISDVHAPESFTCEFQIKKSRKVTSFYSFHNSPASQDILSPPPQI